MLPACTHPYQLSLNSSKNVYHYSDPTKPTVILSSTMCSSIWDKKKIAQPCIRMLFTSIIMYSDICVSTRL